MILHRFSRMLAVTALAVAVAAMVSCQRETRQQAEAQSPETGTAFAPDTLAETPPRPSETPAAGGDRPVAPPTRGGGRAPGGAGGVAPGTVSPTPVAPAPPPPPPRKQATLAAGTAIEVRTTNTLSTKVVKTGERFVATLEQPLMSGTWVIAPKGATVEGKIVEADEGGRVKGLASLTVALTALTTEDGQRVPLETNSVSVQAKSSVKKDVAKTGIATGVGAAVGAIAGGGKGAAIGAGVGAGAGAAGTLATRGDPAVIPAETVLHFQLAAPVTVTERR